MKRYVAPLSACYAFTMVLWLLSFYNVACTNIVDIY